VQESCSIYIQHIRHSAIPSSTSPWQQQFRKSVGGVSRRSLFRLLPAIR
jgi:hypothetical protein